MRHLTPVAAKALRAMKPGFFPAQKKRFNSCTYAAINIQGDTLYEIWGEFIERSEAEEAKAIWEGAYKDSSTGVSVKEFEGRFRTCVNF